MKFRFPYDTDANEVEMLAQIKELAATCIRSGHVSVDWPDYLGIYLELKYTLSQQDRIWFAEILYDVATSGDDIAISEPYLFLITVLLKESKIKPDSGLIIDWQPIYNMIKKCTDDKLSNTNMAYTILPAYLDCLKTVQRHFDPQETINILEEFIPRLNPMIPGSCIAQFNLLAQFLPTSKPPDGKSFFWIPKLFDIWESISWSHEFSSQFCELLAVLVMDQRYSPQTVPWTDSKLRKVFSYIMSTLDFVDGTIGDPQDPTKMPALFNREYFTTSSGQLEYKSSTWGPAKGPMATIGAQLFVYTLYPRAANLEYPTFDCLLDLIDIVEPFCHPSSSGPWTLRILDLLSEICRLLVIRRKKEARPDDGGPQCLKLTQDMLDTITGKMIPLALLTVFGEEEYEVEQSQKIMNYLSMLSPGLVFEKVFPSVFNSLESLVVPHRTRSALALLATSIKTIVRDDAARYIPKLMMLSLPGIDFNDEVKSSLAIAFYTCLGMFVPISSNSIAEHDTERMEETDSIIAATAIFPEWIELFMENLFLCIRNLPEQTVTIGANPLTNLVGMMCQSIFSGLSPDLESILLRILSDHLTHVLPFALDITSVIYGTFSQRNPEKRLSAFLPVCCRKIAEDIECGLGSNFGKSETLPFKMASQSDADLHWYQAILISICSMAGESLLLYKFQLFEIMKLMITKCNSRLGSRLTFQLIFYVLESLLQIYSLNGSTHSFKAWDDPEFVSNIVRHWSDKVVLENFDADWHIPSGQEIDFGLEILEYCIELVAQNLRDLLQQEHLDGTKNSRYALFQKWVDLLSVLIVSSQYILKPKCQTADRKYRSHSGPHIQFQVDCYYTFNDQNSPGYKRWEGKLAVLGEILQEAVKYFTEEKCEDPTSSSLLIFCISSFVAYRFSVENLENYNNDITPMVHNISQKWTKPRALRCREAYLLHHRRLSFAKQFAGLSSLDSTLLMHLLEFCVSRYKSVRSMAIKSLRSIVLDIRPIFDHVFKAFNSILNNSQSEDYQIDGVFETLTGISEQTTLLLRTHWEYFFDLSTSVLKLMASRNFDNKVSKLIDDFHTIMLNNLSLASKQLCYSKRSLDLVSSILTSAKYVNLRDERNKNLAEYQIRVCEYREFLLDLVKDTNYQWKIGLMVAEFLSVLVFNFDPVGPAMIKFALDGLRNDNDLVKGRCMTLFCQIATILKKRAKVANTCHSFKFKKLLNNSDSIYENIISQFSQHNPNAKYFMDHPEIGFFCFPTTLPIYVKALVGVEVEDQGSCEATTVIQSFIDSKNFWNEFIEIMVTISEDESAENSIGIFVAVLLYFDINGGSLNWIMDAVIDLAQRDTVGAHRVGSELLLGLLYHFRHRPDGFRTLKLSIDSAVSAIYEKQFEFSFQWSSAIGQVFSTYDANRYLDVVDLLKQIFRNENSGLRQVNGMVLICCILNHCRLNDSQINDWFKIFLERLGSAYQENRDAIGSAIDLCSQQYSKSQEILTINQFLGQKENFGLCNPHQTLRRLLLDFDLENVNDIKTCLSWFVHGFYSFNSCGFTSYYVDFLLFIGNVSARTTDPDLLEQANETLKLYPHYAAKSTQVEPILNILLQFCTATNPDYTFHFKIRILNILHTFYFKHLMYLSHEGRYAVFNAHIELSNSQSVELRNTASKNLSGILKCSLRSHLPSIAVIYTNQAKYIVELKSLALPKLLIREVTEEVYKDHISKRHSVISILCSVILAFPFEVPDWLVECIMAVASSSSNPTPIRELVKRTFSEFKKTHQDTWEIDKLQFTSDQLSTLTDLIVSPSYYA